MSMSEHPYSRLPDKSFWKRAVATRHVTELSDVHGGISNLADLKIATAGSCFAQHIGKNLRKRNLQYMDYEPAPSFLSESEAENLGYGIYSCRYGNIYSARQLVQLVDEVLGERVPDEVVWERGGRYFDALRPGVERGGFASVEEVLALRAYHLGQVRKLLFELDLFVFTLGLTETWVSVKDGTAYPSAPGVVAGEFVDSKYSLVNFRYNDIYEDLSSFILKLAAINSKAKVLLTVSPVSLAATATSNHVLVASTYSKSTLRAVAGDISADFSNVDYFPSYELIATHPSRGMYFNSDLRTVCESGVATVMRHFFCGVDSLDTVALPLSPSLAERVELEAYSHCEEVLNDPTERGVGL